MSRSSPDGVNKNEGLKGENVEKLRSFGCEHDVNLDKNEDIKFKESDDGIYKDNHHHHEGDHDEAEDDNHNNGDDDYNEDDPDHDDHDEEEEEEDEDDDHDDIWISDCESSSTSVNKLNNVDSIDIQPPEIGDDRLT